MNRIEIKIAEKEFVFSVKFVDDEESGAPWENSEAHGVISESVTREKRPGELLLKGGRPFKIFYDFAETCKLALRDGWDSEPYNDGHQTKRQQAAKAARADYEYLLGWCDGSWGYVGVVVTLLDRDGEETEVSDSIWGVDTYKDNHFRQAREIADELAAGYKEVWDEVEKQTFSYVNGAK